ncbi:MAG TPA: molybdate ABC transporter substrate-binding protein [Nitrospirota bacterium]|nr:molybdate ABC transporter substrate-binding protein [Nitrospirota bacterium]
MTKKLAVLLVISFFSAVLPVGIALAGPTMDLTVSAAISLKNAFEEIGKLYESRNKNTKVLFNLGASGDLVTQIKGGAPIDVFASAALKDMDKLDSAGFVVKDTRTNFAANTVVLIVPSSSKITIPSFEDLKKPEIKKIAMGNPKTVPAGRYAAETFQYYKISDMIHNKLILTENVRQVLDYVYRGEVDAGVVYSTDAMVRQQGVKIILTAPEASHKPVIYPIAVVKGTKNEQAANSFVALVTSEEGQKILSQYGFKPIASAK